MINDKLSIAEGKFIRVENIIEKEDSWQFIKNDPQIFIGFEKPIKGARFTFEIEKANIDFLNTVIYFRTENNNFSEQNKVIFQLNTKQRTNHEIYFFEDVCEIRLDIHDADEIIKVKDITIEVLDDHDNVMTCLKKNINISNNEEKIVLLSHDLSGTGAPILAYNIAKSLQQLNKDVVVLVGQSTVSFLLKKYRESNIPVIFLDDNRYNYSNAHVCLNYNRIKEYTGDEYVNIILEMLRNEGFSNVITNTVVGGKFVKNLKNYNFKIISLIHEMKTTIELYGFYNYGKDISIYSDYIVFPDETVRNDFENLYKKINGKCLIRPQGVYLNKKIEGNKNNFYFSNYGFNLDDYIIMNSGTCELRKGIDLFLESATILKNICDRNIHYVWTGNFGGNRELEGWIRNQIKKSNLESNFHIIPFIENQDEYKTLLSNVNIFWSTSREDPFPSVVLEALNYNITVIGFKNAGGINTMLDNNRGYLISDFNVAQLASISKQIIEADTDELDYNSINDFLNTLKFKDYVDFLSNTFNYQEIVKPSLDLFKWKKSSKLHYYELQLPNKTYEEKEAQLQYVIKNNKKRRIKYANDIVLLDTAIGSGNVGDEIIMSYCEKICKDIFKNSNFLHIPTHIYDDKSENISNNFKILCGTNLIYKKMEESRQLSIPNNLESMKNICLLGVGMQQIGLEEDMSNYSKQLLNFILSSDVIHSVKDNETKIQLENIGITNVLNTSCPTMWALTPEHCKKIPVKKAEAVLTTVTDYMQDSEIDVKMLEILKNNYSKVYIWVQGQYDYEYLQSLTDLKNFIIIPPSLEELDKILENEDIDYIGTRLHAGIRSLNFLKRSLIIAVDNRARAIHNDTNLPIMERYEIEENLANWINSAHETNINLPIDAINKWINQFNQNSLRDSKLKKVLLRTIKSR